MGERTNEIPETRRVRRGILTAALLVILQSSVGMIVNLYVAIPPSHPGAHPQNYFSGSLHSIAWAISNGAAALAIHAALGLTLVVVAVAVAALALAARARVTAAWTITAAGLTIGAGFNGASFLDFAHNYSSLIMALLALAAIACYLLAFSTVPGDQETAPR